MKQSLNKAFWLAAISPVALMAGPENSIEATRSSLAFPAPHQWHFTFGANTGAETYTIQYAFGADQDGYYGSALALGLDQSVGYGRWFYVQAKESSATSIADYSFTDYTGGANWRSRVSFFDFDIRAYFPLPLSHTYRISLQPQIGFALHMTHIRARGIELSTIDDRYTRYKAHALAPLLGLALGCEVSPRFNFRFAIALEIESLMQRKQYDPTNAPIDWLRLKQRRCGLHSTLDLSYKAGERLDLTGAVDHLNYNPSSDPEGTPSAFLFSYLSRFSYKLGLRWNY